ncbi:MAG: DNA-binding protein, partial [Phycisphaerales bacterium]|nr:DNA-binding protein [Phycisphaerales bacterium]
RADGTLDAFDRPAAAGPWEAALSRKVAAGLNGVAASADGRTLVACGPGGTVVQLDPSDAAAVRRLRGHPGTVTLVRLGEDGGTLVSAGTDPDVRVWARGAGGSGEWRVVRTLRNGGETLGAAIAPDGKRLVTTSRPDRLRVWSLADGQCVRDARLDWTPWAAALSPDGRRLAVGTWGRSLSMWDLSDFSAGGTCRPAVLEGHAQMPVADAFDPSGRLLASASPDGPVRVWDAAAAADASPPGRLLATLDARAGAVTRVAFVPAGDDGGNTVAGGYADGTVRLWDLHSADRAVANQEAYQRSLRAAR